MPAPDHRPVAMLIDAGRFMRDLDAIVDEAAGRSYTTILLLHASDGSSASGRLLSRRIFSTVPDVYPVGQPKALERSPWLDRLYLRHEPFLASGAEALARVYPDYETVLRLDATRLANFPIVGSDSCIGFINIAQSAEHDARRMMAIGPKAAMLFGPVAATLLDRGWFPD